jgi:uncharacterized membrane protein YphA (DoxX/SURF4 family)
MNTVLWVAQIVLGAIFILVGLAKILVPKEKAQERMKWVEDFAPNTIKGIGTLEVLGGIGLILPAALGILPWLTPLAAIGLALVMIGAMMTHARRREYPMMIPNIVLMLAALFIAYGRIVAVPLVN